MEIKKCEECGSEFLAVSKNFKPSSKNGRNYLSKKCRICLASTRRQKRALKQEMDAPFSGVRCHVDLVGEVWRKLVGYQDYDVSNMGRVRTWSFWRTNGGYPRLMAGWLRTDGYVGCSLKNGQESKTFLLHRLIAEAFIPADPAREFINHIDGVKNNNAVENLERVTAKENVAHAISTGLTKIRIRHGEASSNRKLTWAIVCEIRESNESARILAQKYNVRPATIRDVRAMRTWLQKRLVSFH